MLRHEQNLHVPDKARLRPSHNKTYAPNSKVLRDGCLSRDADCDGLCFASGAMSAPIADADFLSRGESTHSLSAKVIPSGPKTSDRGLDAVGHYCQNYCAFFGLGSCPCVKTNHGTSQALAMFCTTPSSPSHHRRCGNCRFPQSGICRCPHAKST